MKTEADFHPALRRGKGAHMDRYTVTPTDVTDMGSACYRAGGAIGSR